MLQPTIMSIKSELHDVEKFDCQENTVVVLVSAAILGAPKFFSFNFSGTQE